MDDPSVSSEVVQRSPPGGGWGEGGGPGGVRQRQRSPLSPLATLAISTPGSPYAALPLIQTEQLPPDFIPVKNGVGRVA